MKRTKPTGRCIQVAVVENDPLRMAGFRALLDSYADLELASVALSELGNRPTIDVVLLGKCANQNLFEMMEYLRKLRPDLRVIVTANDKGDDSILDSLASGARGYVDEAASAEEFVNAIRIVDEGVITENSVHS